MRYYRQQIMAEIGEEGQQKLRQASVLVIGAGGLGSPVLTYLASAGVGRIHVADFDHITLSNLNRQYLHSSEDLEQPKAESAKAFIRRVNPETAVFADTDCLTEANIDQKIAGKQVVVDCVDNIETRMLVNRACVRAGIPLVEGAVNGFYGFVFAVGRGTPCLACLGYQNTQIKKPVPVLGTTAGVIGTLQANECLKILIGQDQHCYGKMTTYDGLELEFDHVPVKISDRCPNHK